MPGTSVEKLARRILALERRQFAQSTQPQLANSSVDGAVITIQQILTDPNAGNGFWVDTATATVDGDPVNIALHFEPRPYSMHVYVDGLHQEDSSWTRAGLALTFTNAHIKAGSVVTAKYAIKPLEAVAVIPVITSPTNASTTVDTTPTITGTGSGLRAIQVFVDGVSVGTTTAAADGSWTVTVGSALSTGAHVITVTQTELDGSLTPSAAVSFNVGTVPLAPVGVTTGHVANTTHVAVPGGASVGDFFVLAIVGPVSGPSAVSSSDSRIDTSITAKSWCKVFCGNLTDLSDLTFSVSGGSPSGSRAYVLSVYSGARTVTSHTEALDQSGSTDMNLPALAYDGNAIGVVFTDISPSGSSIPPGDDSLANWTKDGVDSISPGYVSAVGVYSHLGDSAGTTPTSAIDTGTLLDRRDLVTIAIT